MCWDPLRRRCRLLKRGKGYPGGAVTLPPTPVSRYKRLASPLAGAAAVSELDVALNNWSYSRLKLLLCIRQSSWAVPHNPVLKYCSMHSWRSWVGQFASQ
jgi:hypothetical protein